MAAVQMQRLDRVAAIQATMAAAAELECQNDLALHSDDFADDEDVIIEIERLLSLGVPQADLIRLKSAGIVTVAGALMTSKKTLMEIKGLTEPKIIRIFAACQQLSSTTFMTAIDLLQKRKSVIKVTTGSESLDSLLAGGIESGSITEVFGEFRTGKSQLAHTLCVTAQLPKDHRGGNGKVAFIDTDGTFRPERIVPIAERFGIDPMMTLENIVYARAFSHEQQDALVTTIAGKMVNDQFAMLIIDSFMNLFRVEFVGREELAPRQQAIGSLMNKLIKVATEFNIAVLITNQVMADPSNGSSSLAGGEASKKPLGGHVVAHASTTRLSFRKGLGGKRICKVYDSPCLPESEATFSITNGGIADLTS